jgi:hypothetical protein
MERSRKSARRRYTSAVTVAPPIRAPGHRMHTIRPDAGEFPTQNPCEAPKNGAERSFFSLPTTIDIVVGKV